MMPELAGKSPTAPRTALPNDPPGQLLQVLHRQTHDFAAQRRSHFRQEARKVHMRVVIGAV
jgi:hypothetical protein